MKVCFVYGAHENLGIEYLSSVLKQAGHQVQLAFDPLLFNDAYINVPFLKGFFGYRQKLLDEIFSGEPDLIAFSVVTDDFQWACQIALDIKKVRKDIPIVFGGIHPTSLPEYVIQQPFEPIVCIGEGEFPLLDLVTGLEKNGGIENCLDIQNFWFKWKGEIIKNAVRPLIQDLDILPFADKEIFYEKTLYFSKIYTVMTARGCPYKCSYCCNDVISSIYKGKGKILRQRSVDNVLNELVEMKTKWNYKSVSFYDDTFAFNKNWLGKFCSEYKKRIDLPFRCIIHPKFVDEYRIALLKKAGCVNLELGIQSISEPSRHKILDRHESNSEIKKALTLLKEAGIGFSVDHILGIPYENEQDQIEAVKFYNELRPDLIDTFWMTYYPRTKIVDIALQAGILSEGEKNKIEAGLGTSHAYAGKRKNEKSLIPFQFLFGYLPFIPTHLVYYILKKKWYRFFTINSLFLSTVLPRFIRAFFWNDYNARNQMKRNYYLLIYFLKKRFSEINVKDKKRV